MGVQTKGYIAFQAGWFKRENPHWYLLFLIHLVKCRSSLQWTKKQPLYYFYQFRSKIHSRLFLFFNPHAKICLLISEKERERGREKHRCEIDNVREKDWSAASCTAPSGDWTLSLDMCPDQESNPQPFGVWDDAPANWVTWSGPF